MNTLLKQVKEFIYKPKKVYRFTSETTGEECEAVEEKMISQMIRIRDVFKNMFRLFLYKRHLKKRIDKNNFGRREEW